MEKNENEKQISAVTRAFHVLETLAKHNSIHLESLSKETGLPKSTLIRFLSTLTSLGYVLRDQNDQYSLSLKMFSLGSNSLESTDFHRVAKQAADKLVEKLGETVHIGVLEKTAVVYIIKVEPKKSVICLQSRVGKSNPLHCTAGGKTLLAHVDDDKETEKILERMDFLRRTPTTIIKKSDLKKELETIRKNGWAKDNEENEKGVICLSAPIFNYTQKAVAAISVSWPSFRFEEEKQEEYLSLLTGSAFEVSTVLGYINRN